jgi:hypothetical protein
MASSSYITLTIVWYSAETGSPFAGLKITKSVINSAFPHALLFKRPSILGALFTLVVLFFFDFICLE